MNKVVLSPECQQADLHGGVRAEEQGPHLHPALSCSTNPLQLDMLLLKNIIVIINFMYMCVHLHEIMCKLQAVMSHLIWVGAEN